MFQNTGEGIINIDIPTLLSIFACRYYKMSMSAMHGAQLDVEDLDGHFND